MYEYEYEFEFAFRGKNHIVTFEQEYRPKNGQPKKKVNLKFPYSLP